MDWILYIVLGVFVIVILSAIGFFTEFLKMIFIALFAGVISGGVSALLEWGFPEGFGVGVIIGLVLFGVYCLIRMCSDDNTKTITDGREEEESERFNGIIGIIVMIVVCGLLWAVIYFYYFEEVPLLK